MSEKILVLAEHRSGKVKGISWEAIGFSQKLGSQLSRETAVVLLGHEVDALATEITQRCGQPVLVASDPSLANYTPEAHCAALSRILEQQSPLLLLMGHTYQAIDFAPKLATMLGRGFIPNCVDYQWDGTQLTFVRQVFNGKLNLRLDSKAARLTWFRFSREHSTPTKSRSRRIRTWSDWISLCHQMFSSARCWK